MIQLPLRILCFWMVTVALGATPLRAGLILVGDHVLAPNTPNQFINIYASPSFPGEVAAGLNFNIVLDDGGSLVGGSDINSPIITLVNLKPTGGLFASIPDFQTNLLSSPKLTQASIVPTSVANRPTIMPNSLLAQIVFDTTGFDNGTWQLRLDGLPGVGLPGTDFAGAPTTLTNGSISISPVPEPSSLLMVAVLAVTGCYCRVGRRIVGMPTG